MPGTASGPWTCWFAARFDIGFATHNAAKARVASTLVRDMAAESSGRIREEREKSKICGLMAVFRWGNLVIELVDEGRYYC